MHFLLANMTNLKLQHDQIKLSLYRLLLQNATLSIVQEKGNIIITVRYNRYVKVPTSLCVACWRISESRSDEKRRELRFDLPADLYTFRSTTIEMEDRK